MNSHAIMREELVKFLATICRPGCNVKDADDDTDLFDAGYLDSLAVIEIILHMETQYGVSFAASGLDPSTLGTIHGMLEVLKRAGA